MFFHYGNKMLVAGKCSRLREGSFSPTGLSDMKH